MSNKVLVCGGRDFCDTPFLTRVLMQYNRENPIDIIIHGDARGADRTAKAWAEVMRIPVKAYPAQWYAYGKRAGYIRNRQMLDEGKPDVVIAFPGGAGTRNMIEISRRAGVKVLLAADLDAAVPKQAT